MDIKQQVLWIISFFGLMTMIGVLRRMNPGFGPMNLRAVGLVLIAVLATLLSMIQTESVNAAIGILGTIAGYLFGAKATEKPAESSGVKSDGSTFGDNATLVGRDLNTTIKQLRGDIKEIKDSMITQVSKVGSDDIGEVLKTSVVEFLFLTFFSSVNEPLYQAATRLRTLQLSGWTLFSASGSYS